MELRNLTPVFYGRRWGAAERARVVDWNGLLEEGRRETVDGPGP